MTSWAVSLWPGFSDTEEIRLYTEFASCNIYSIQHKHTQGAYGVKNKAVTLIKRSSSHVRWDVLHWLVCVLVEVQVEGKVCECVLDSGPQRAEDHWESSETLTATSALWKTLSQGQREGGYIINIKNIQYLQEHELTWCVSGWTKRTGPEWSSVTRSMWMCVGRCVNVLRVLHCSFLNAQAVSIKNTVWVWGTIRNGADRP